MKVFYRAALFCIFFSSQLLSVTFYKPGVVVINETVGNFFDVTGAIALRGNIYALTSFKSPSEAIEHFSQSIIQMPFLDKIRLQNMHKAWLRGHKKTQNDSNSVLLALKENLFVSNQGACSCGVGYSLKLPEEEDEGELRRLQPNIRQETDSGYTLESDKYTAIILAIGDISQAKSDTLLKNFLFFWKKKRFSVTSLLQEHQVAVSNYVKSMISDEWSLLNLFSPDIRQICSPCGYISVMVILIDNNVFSPVN